MKSEKCIQREKEGKSILKRVQFVLHRHRYIVAISALWTEGRYCKPTAVTTQCIRTSITLWSTWFWSYKYGSMHVVKLCNVDCIWLGRWKQEPKKPKYIPATLLLQLQPNLRPYPFNPPSKRPKYNTALKHHTTARLTKLNPHTTHRNPMV
jgi:hypothetical protein